MIWEGNMNFRELFKPVEIGKISIKNRIAMAPMGLDYPLITAKGELTQMGVEYYVERGKKEM